MKIIVLLVFIAINTSNLYGQEKETIPQIVKKYDNRTNQEKVRSCKQETIYEKISKHKELLLTETNCGKGLSLKTLINKSDLIISCKIIDSTSYLNLDETQIMTDNEIEVRSIIKNKLKKDHIILGQPIDIIRKGGILFIEDTKVIMYKNGFPPFKRGEEFILFIKKNQNNEFVILGDGDGCYQVIKGSDVEKEKFIQYLRKHTH